VGVIKETQALGGLQLAQWALGRQQGIVMGIRVPPDIQTLVEIGSVRGVRFALSRVIRVLLDEMKV
jgi:hypothetical protein